MVRRGTQDKETESEREKKVLLARRYLVAVQVEVELNVEMVDVVLTQCLRSNQDV